MSDYSFEVEVSEEEVQAEIERAREFLDFTKEYLSNKGLLEGEE